MEEEVGQNCTQCDISHLKHLAMLNQHTGGHQMPQQNTQPGLNASLEHQINICSNAVKRALIL